jgi:hypothetical protein
VAKSDAAPNDREGPREMQGLALVRDLLMAKENRMRVAIVVIAGLMLAGCAEPVTVENPRTGQSLVCSDGAGDWSPWSQQEACVAGHLAQGWTIVSRAPE